MATYPETLFPQIAQQEKRAFLAAFASTGRIRRASEAAQVNWRNHYNWLRDDPQYLDAFAEAQRIAADFFEDEAVRRATEGWERKVFHQGQHVDNEKVYSDVLLMFTLKGWKPEKYKDRAEVTGPQNGPLQITLTTYTAKDA